MSILYAGPYTSSKSCPECRAYIKIGYYLGRESLSENVAKIVTAASTGYFRLMYIDTYIQSRHILPFDGTLPRSVVVVADDRSDRLIITRIHACICGCSIRSNIPVANHEAKDFRRTRSECK